MGEPTIGSVHQNAALTNVAVNYSNQNYVLGGAFPIVSVVKASDVYHVWNKGELLRRKAGYKRPGARANRGTFKLDNPVAYTCQKRAFAWEIPDEVRENADPAIKADLDATKKTMDQIMADREYIIATALTTAGNWTANGDGGTGTTSLTGAHWDDSGGDPIGAFETALKNVQGCTGYIPNLCVMNWKVYRALRNHNDIIDRIKYVGGQSPPAVPSLAVIAEVLDIPKILVVTGIENTAAENLTPVYENLMTDTVWVGYVTGGPSIYEPSAGYVFRKGGPTTKSYREEAESQDVVESWEYYTVKVVAGDCGYTLTDALV